MKKLLKLVPLAAMALALAGCVPAGPYGYDNGGSTVVYGTGWGYHPGYWRRHHRRYYGGRTYNAPINGGGGSYHVPIRGGGRSYNAPVNGGGGSYHVPVRRGGRTYRAPINGGGGSYHVPVRSRGNARAKDKAVIKSIMNKI